MSQPGSDVFVKVTATILGAKDKKMAPVISQSCQKHYSTLPHKHRPNISRFLPERNKLASSMRHTSTLLVSLDAEKM